MVVLINLDREGTNISKQQKIQPTIINIWKNPIYFLAFGFGSGALPIAPGTWGTLAAIPFYLLIQNLPWQVYAVILLSATVVGAWICDVTERAIGIPDYSGIVWDEICGYLLTMFVAPHGWEWVVWGFILFRLFDIWKPWPIRWADRHLPGGLGVMMDDLLAAVYAWVMLQVVFHLTLEFGSILQLHWPNGSV